MLAEDPDFSKSRGNENFNPRQQGSSTTTESLKFPGKLPENFNPRQQGSDAIFAIPEGYKKIKKL
jgi:hypothetical protein